MNGHLEGRFLAIIVYMETYEIKIFILFFHYTDELEHKIKLPYYTIFL
jgi:hypothetical protein